MTPPKHAGRPRGTDSPIAAARDARHLTQAAAAAAAGMQQQTWAAIESAPGNLTLDTLARVARVVGVEAVLRLVRDCLGERAKVGEC